MTGAIAKAEEHRRLRSRADTFCCSSSRTRPTRRSTRRPPGPEIWDDTDGGVDVFVSGVGTGGTITGVSRYIKHTKGKPIQLGRGRAGGQPDPDAEARRPAAASPGPHKIQGIGAGFIPDVLDLSLVDASSSVSNEEAILLCAPPRARGGHPVRHFQRRRRGRRRAAREEAGKRRQDDRRHPARIPASAI